MYLAAAGVGKLGIVDFDTVDLTNLQRQIAHGTSDVGRPKVESAAERLREINPGVDVVPYNTILTSDNAFEVFEPYDIIVDGSDNFPVRYLSNDASQMLGKPLVYGSIFQWEGQPPCSIPGTQRPGLRATSPHPPRREGFPPSPSGVS